MELTSRSDVVSELTYLTVKNQRLVPDIQGSCSMKIGIKLIIRSR